MERPKLKDLTYLKEQVQDQEEKIREFKPEIEALVRKGNYSLKAQLTHTEYRVCQLITDLCKQELMFTEYILFLENKVKKLEKDK